MSSLGASVLADIIAGGGVLVLSGMVALLFKRLPKEVSQLSRDWYGLPARPGFPPVPGVPQRLEGVESTLGELRAMVVKIDHEVHPNSGESMKDKVDRTATTVTALTQDVRTIRAMLTSQPSMKQNIGEIHDMVSSQQSNQQSNQGTEK